MVTLIGMDRDGRFVGIKVLKHSGAHLAAGHSRIGADQLQQPVPGQVGHRHHRGRPSRPDENVIGVDAISGATVTVVAQNQVVMASGGAVARQTGIIAPTVREPARFAASGQAYDWAQLVKMGAVQRLLVKPEQVGLPRGPEPFIELWFGDLNHPDVGTSVLGKLQL